jgi:putative permease
VPAYVTLAQTEIREFATRHPDLLDQKMLTNITANMTEVITKLSREAVAKTFTLLPNLVSVLIYLIMVPMLTLFILKDKDQIHNWFKQFLPKDLSLATTVWRDVDQQMGNYIRGKLIEIIAVGITTFIGLAVFDLDYALMLAVLVGVSVLIPYIGVTVVTVPVVLVAYSKFGISEAFGYLILVYLIIQALDAYVLVPILFSEAVDLHPAAILIAILFFGGLWGFWGLFFAIPLAALIQAIILAWPRPQMEQT